jgi:putative transposase
VKLTLKIKLLPSDQQANWLLQTIQEANRACNLISGMAWEKKAFQQFKLHKASYHSIKASTDLSSQVMVRCISKVADAYKLDRKVKRTFNPLGAICYDSRILTYTPNNGVSIWSVGGRLKMPFVCHNPYWLASIKGEADLLFRKGKFYLFQTVEVEEEAIQEVEEFIGVDMGLTKIATLSNGKIVSSEKLTKYREKRQKIRSSLQSKCTKNARRVLKRLSGRERTTARIINHTISKQIVAIAKTEGKGIAIENLKGIRSSASKKGKKFRSRVGKWNFHQLRRFLSYKCLLQGVKLVDVPAAYTSKTCHKCLHIGNRQGKKFTCTHCKASFDSDINAAKNIALLGMNVNRPEKPSMLYCTVHPAQV